jgi:hypothetical protein
LVAATDETEREIRACIDRFLVELRELLQRLALEAVRARFGSGEPALTPAQTLSSARRRPVPERTARARASRAQAKRSPAIVAKTAELVLEYVKAHSGTAGIDIGELRSGLAMSSDELRLPLRKLIEQGELRTSGQRRGTRYLPAPDAAGSGGARGRTAPLARRPARGGKPARDPIAPLSPVRQAQPQVSPAEQGQAPPGPVEIPARLPSAEPEPELATASF